MKKLFIVSIIILLAFSCNKREWEVDICISTDETTVAVDEEVSIENCGTLPPSEYVDAELDWGDGTVTDGLSGTHSYDEIGTYQIKVYLNGEYAPEITEIEDESKVKIEITVQ